MMAAAAGLGACVPSSKGNESSAKSSAASDESLAGYWKLAASSESDAGGGAPRVLKLEINRNGFRQADYCDIGGQPNEGAGQYELKDGTLTISYIGFPNVAARGLNESPQDLIYSARVTEATAASLVLDGVHRYERFAPVQDPITGVLKVGICDTPPPVDQPRPSDLASAADLAETAQTSSPASGEGEGTER